MAEASQEIGRDRVKAADTGLRVGPADGYGSREILALDGRSEPSPVVLVNVAFSGWDDAIW
jgi:hypothetical protein